MSDPLTVGAALSAAGGGASLVNNILTFIKEARKANRDPRIADVLARLRPEAFSLAGQYVQQIQDLRQALLDAGVDLTKTQREVLKDTGMFKFRRKKLLTKFSANIDAIESQLSRFLDDAVAVAQCCGDEEFVVASFVEGEEMRTVIHRETDPANSLESVLKSLEGRAQSFRAALGDLK
jgi:exonuclease VII large subunit